MSPADTRIPERFYRADKMPIAYTVGEVIKLLQELPTDLEIKQGFGDGVMVCVYNNFLGNVPHLQFDEEDDW